MALSHRLILKQTQSLVMTPQLQQAIELLQMSNMELADFVEEELRENPLLEAREADEDSVAEAAGDTQGDDAAANGTDAEPPQQDSLDRANADSLPAEDDRPLDTDYENAWNTADSGIPAGETPSFGTLPAGPGGRSDFSEFSADIEASLSQPPTLRDHLHGQLNVDITDPGDRLIGLHIIEMLDEKGWVPDYPGDIAERLGCARERVDGVLDMIQRFDPPGIFARTAAECLALQLRDRNRLDPAMQALLDNLHLWEKCDWPALRRICGVDSEDIEEMIAEIRTLQPKPADAFVHEVAQPVIPDILMRALPDGDWHFELNPDTLPRILVDRQYFATVSRGARKPEEKKYLNEKLQSANWLKNALDQRQKTILKVVTEIVRQQDAFFRFGVSHMRPLVLRDIADVVNTHESNVSRVTSNKYLATPRGVFELKYFFTSALSSNTGGDTHSAEAVRHRIKALCDEESVESILSDDGIAEVLRGEDIDIARRTVAKYREAMRIPSSIRRRRQKKMPLR